MTAVNRFFVKTLLLSLIIIASVLLLNKLFIIQNYPYEYLGGMLNDKHKIAEQTRSPKIIWVGGSSGSFGLNSDTLQKYIGMPVVNMSFIGPLGTYFLMNDALKEIRKGDKVFVSTEYDIEKYGKPEVIFSAVDYYPEGSGYIKKDTSIIQFIGNRAKHKLANLRKLFWNTLTGNEGRHASVKDNTSVYFRSAFSDKGDIISHLNNNSRTFNLKLFPNEYVNFQEQIKDINHLVTEARNRGAEVCYIFPPLAESTYLYGKIAVESIETQLRAGLKCPILGTSKDYVRKDSSFFDSFYHLKPTTRDLNTLKIVELYKQK